MGSSSVVRRRAIREVALLLVALAIWAEPTLARSYLSCPAKQVVIIYAPTGSRSSTIEVSLGFWIDEASKTILLDDGTPLTVHRLDDRWISAARGDMTYEFDRQNGNLTYASSTTKDSASTVIIGSGRCKMQPVQQSELHGGAVLNPRVFPIAWGT